MVFSINNVKVVLTEADEAKEPCKGCCFNQNDNVCPTIKKEAWTALMCEMKLSDYGTSHFKTLN